jgi:2,3-diphosphopglycerate-independent phosphoglycerate mutase
MANIVLFRGCGGRLKEIPTFKELHQMKSFMIAPTCMISGLGAMLEMDLIHAPGATGDYNSNWISKGTTAMGLIQDRSKNYSFGFLHVKAVDDAGHDGSLDRKQGCLESIDQMIGNILSLCKIPMIFVLTGDHSTPIWIKDHSNEPVPFCISFIDKDIPFLQDKVSKFDEISAAQGNLGRFTGTQVMPLIKTFRKRLAEKIFVQHIGDQSKSGTAIDQ